jgi:hypothetical protein
LDDSGDINGSASVASTNSSATGTSATAKRTDIGDDVSPSARLWQYTNSLMPHAAPIE